MTTWYEKKKEYYNRIASYDIDVEELIKLDKLNLSNMILNPRTQKEMDFCDSFILMLSDLTKMKNNIHRISYDEEDNKFNRYFRTYVSKVLDGESLDKELFLINIDANNSLNIDINTNVIGEYNPNNSIDSYFIECYSEIIYDLIPAIYYGNIFDTALKRSGINTNYFFERLLVKSINNVYEKEKSKERKEVDKEKLLEFYTKLFYSFHQLTEENMKLERRK